MSGATSLNSFVQQREEDLSIRVHESSQQQDIKEIAESLVGDFRRYAAAAEELRRVPDESVNLLKSSGLLHVLQPAACGGKQLTMRAHVDAVSTVARGCNAAAWVLGVYHAHSWVMGHMNPKAQEDVYGQDPDQAIAAVIGPRGKAVRRVDGSFVLSGFWPFGSGNSASNWLLLGTEVFDENGVKLDEADLLVPVSDVELLDDWYVAGLQGTGSSSIRCANVVVPAHRFLSLSAIMENNTAAYNDPDGPSLYKAQAGPVLTLCIASSATGVARGALDEFIRVVPGKKVLYTPHISHEWIPVQKALGEAASMIHAAELLVYRVADDIDGYAARGEKMPMELRGGIRMDIALAMRLCRDAVEKLYTIGGAAGLTLRSPIQRAARNLQAINMHGLLLYDAGAELYGRILLGLDPGTPTI
jgi:3-hydroxy-9,10-secoandrosta-1,3,5(10)-triene-9,17-dione monooxygenase